MRLDGSDVAAIGQAADLIAAGELVAFATETVYGLGARADDDAAVAKIFRTKGRPAGHPLIVHVVDRVAASAFSDSIPPVAERLMSSFWPGPLTLILARREGIAAGAAGQQKTIGLRSPVHPVAQALLQACAARGVPGVAAPSANLFGHVSPTQASHVVDEFGDSLAVLDGGTCPLGIESSIIDCSRGYPVLLRPGVLTRAQLEAAAGETLGVPDASSPRAPGTLASHYAPNAKLRMMAGPVLRAALQLLGNEALTLAVYSRSAPPGVTTGVRHRRMPSQPDQAAHELFSVLRELDAEGVQIIWVEDPPDDPAWDGVRDRLQRAAAT
jgi:L-threonylcarbamoyladenylate synthase